VPEEYQQNATHEQGVRNGAVAGQEDSPYTINADILDVPSGYRQTAQQQGSIVRLDYQTTSYATGQPMQKYALVYLPYGYDEGTTARYNVLYIMHGGGGSQSTYLGGVGQNSQFKNILDNMIQNGDCQPCIVVSPTFYLSGDGDTSVSNSGVAVEQFPTELTNDLMPAVATAYRTYANGSSRDDLRRSRNHRAFGGFSMGSVCTWWTFAKALDCFRYFVPTSGDCWAKGMQGGYSDPTGTAQYLVNAMRESGYTGRDFFIHAMTGSDDIAQPMMTAQIEAMRSLADFSFGTDKRTNNIHYAVYPGGSHTASYAFQYAYNALLHLWKNESDGDDTTSIRPVTM
jgi:enterochelin esterase-like enzyme